MPDKYLGRWTIVAALFSICGVLVFLTGNGLRSTTSNGDDKLTMRSKSEPGGTRGADIGKGRSEILNAQSVAARETQEMSSLDNLNTQIIAMVSMEAPSLELNANETKLFVAAIVDFLHVNSLLTADHARVTRGPNGEIEIVVPSRPEIAEELFEKLKQRLASDLSTKRSDEILLQLGPGLVALFSGYGAADERMTLVPSQVNIGTYSFKFEANIPRTLPSQTTRFLGNSYVGDGEGASSVSLEELGSRPKYAFVARLLSAPH